MTLRVSEVVLPSSLEAVTVSDQRPVVSSYGALNVPSSATATLTCAGVGGFFGAVSPLAGPVYVAWTTTSFALVVVPWTGIAPFSNVAPSAGWSTLSVGVSISRNGTVMKMRFVSSEVFCVVGSRALMSNWLRPRRRSMSAIHAPLVSAVTSIGWSQLGETIETVAPGIEVPRSTYDVAVSSTSTTAVRGCVTAIVGGST